MLEVGINIKGLNKVIIYEGDKIGLSQLHQIRGRIGREGQEAKCYIIGDNLDKINFMKNTKDGIEISKEDLKNRGAGTLYDDYQSGHKNEKYFNKKLCNLIIVEDEDLNLYNSDYKDLKDIENAIRNFINLNHKKLIT